MKDASDRLDCRRERAPSGPSVWACATSGLSTKFLSQILSGCLLFSSDTLPLTLTLSHTPYISCPKLLQCH
jgi:hypothetical protein